MIPTKIDPKNIKLTRKKDEWGGTYYEYEGSEYLGKCTIKKYHDYTIYEVDGYMVGRHKHLRTLADVKRFLSEYDMKAYESKVAEEAEEAAREAKWKARRAEEVRSHNAYINGNLGAIGMVKTDIPAVGEIVEGIFPNLNKNNTIGEYIIELDYATEHRVKIEKVVTLDDAAFAKLASGLLDDENVMDYLKAEDGSFIGGACSEDSRLDVAESWEILNNPELKEIWFETMYIRAVAIVNNGRVILANSEGNSYVRYAGFLKSALINSYKEAA